MRVRSSFRRHKLAGAMVASVCVVGSAVVALSVSLSAQTAPSGADLASEYLAALKPAGTAISTAEAKLEKLPVTASVAQVRAIVAPLGPSLSKLEALTSGSSSTAPATGSGTLESLGPPTVVTSYGLKNGCAGGGNNPTYSTPATGHEMQIGYTRYTHGFQVAIDSSCLYNLANTLWVNYNWKVPSKYTTLKAALGPSYNDVNHLIGIRFLGNGGSPLQITLASGKKSANLVIPKQGTTTFSVDFAGNSVLSLQIYELSGGNTAGNLVMDVVNDHLS